MHHNLSDIASSFEFDGEILDIQPHGSGHINDTYIVRSMLPGNLMHRYLLQRVNHMVFSNPRDLMRNIDTVTKHLYRKVSQEGGDPKRETLNLVPTTAGDIVLEHPGGDWWRAYTYIKGASSAAGKTHLYQAARAFARFQERLSDLPVTSVVDILPGFHDTPVRFAAFAAAVDNDPKNRARGVKKEIELVRERADKTPGLTDLLNRNKLSTRIIHNDTKLNNVLIDNKTNEALCVIDLDTVMPGLPHYDFGDCVRSGANPAAEDERDLSRVFMDIRRFELLTSGYLAIARTFLSSMEIELLPFSTWLMTFECGMRFLTDYLLGDRYFKTHRKDHNLDRCRTNFKLLVDMERKMDRMASLVEKYSTIIT